ncbi:MAG: site-specific DNA-methyltransferase [Nocardiopsaceae bacterium]|nr:site-specific DNA-methyltransferase [Nocardiopsaceae bacterium]
MDSVGEVEKPSAKNNLLIIGDSRDALNSLANDPEFKGEYRGKVQMVYIDPPFNTGQAFANYEDSLEHSIWLTMMRDRLAKLHELMTPTGTIWIHLDSTEVHRCRLLMDDEFGPGNYLATVVWQRTSTKTLARRTMATMHEQILVYGASEAAALTPLFLPLEEEYQERRFSRVDERGPYDSENLTAGYYRPHLDSGKPWKGFNPSDKKRCWAVPSNLLKEIGLDDAKIKNLTMREKLDVLDEAGYISWPEKLDGFPRYKKYLHRAKGRAIGDLWTDINVINSQAVERTGFQTQKPEALIQRILDMGSKPGDIVLDCFAGSGTTAAVAHKMVRRWITIERQQDTVNSYIRPRLESVVSGEDPGGITDKVGWEKGGGFRVLAVGPSMYEVSDNRVFLAEWTHTNGREFAAAVCAQLGFLVTAEPPFVGCKGKMRLAVIDGSVGTEAIRAVVSRLKSDERVIIVARAYSSDAETTLKQLSPGSSIRKAPRDLVKRCVRR